MISCPGFIPLTPKILESCGFGVYMTNAMCLNIDDNFLVLYSDNSCAILNEEKEISESVLLKYEIKYLHQLQNLYRCLTGTELEVNLPVTI